MVYTSRIRGNADRRPQAFWGALIPAAINFVGGLITSSQQARAQKRAMEEQQRLAQQQLQVSNQNNLATTLNNYASAQSSYDDTDYNLKYRNGGTRRLGSNGITITDGGNARKIGNNTFLLRGGSHEDINETGQTGIGINVGGNEIEAEGGEVAQKKNKSLRIFSAQPMLSGGLSPAQAIIRGYNKDKVFAAQQRFKRNNNLNDDGSKFGNGGVNKIYSNYSTTYKNRTTRGNKLSIKKGKVYLNNKPAYAGYKWFDRGNKVDYVVNKDGTYSIYKIHGESPLSRRDESREHYNSIADRVLNIANKTNMNLPLNKTMIDEMKFVKSRLNKENNYIIPNYLPNVKSIKLNTKTKDSTKSVFKDVEIPENMIDSIYKWTKEANQPLYKGFGLIGETSAGKQPPFTKNVAHIVRTPYNFKLVKGRGYYYPTDLANTHHYFISPQTDNINSLINQGLVVPTDDFKKANYLPRTAAYKGDIKNDKIVDEKLKYIRKNDGYSEHPFIHALQYLDKANYGMGKNYHNVVKERGNEFLTDKNVQKRINYIRKNNIYKCGGRIKAKDGMSIHLPSSQNRDFLSRITAGHPTARKVVNAIFGDESDRKRFIQDLNIFGLTSDDARRIAKRFGGIEHARRKYLPGGTANPWDKYRVPDYGGTAPWQVSNKYDVNVPYPIGKHDLPITTITAKKDNFNDEMSRRMRAGVQNLKDNSYSKTTVPYLGRQNTFKPATQDYIGLGIDTLAALGSGLFTRSAYNKLNFDYALPNYVDESPVAFDTIYHNEAQRANVERNRLNSRNLIRGNTSSAQTALGRMQQTDTDAMMELNKLADEKANKEVELRNQNAANEQQVRARNAAARNQYYQNVAQIKNAALEAKNNAALAKAQSIGADLSGLSQAWTNFAGSVEQRYNTRQNEAIIAATSKEPAVLSNALQFGYNFSPEVLASIYRNTNDDKLKQLALSRLSPSDRRRYSLFQ